MWGTNDQDVEDHKLLNIMLKVKLRKYSVQLNYGNTPAHFFLVTHFLTENNMTAVGLLI